MTTYKTYHTVTTG